MKIILKKLCLTWVTLLMMLNVTLPLGAGMLISPIVCGEQLEVRIAYDASSEPAFVNGGRKVRRGSCV